MKFTSTEKNKFDHGEYSIIVLKDSIVLTNSITGTYEIYKSFEAAMKAVELYETKAA